MAIMPERLAQHTVANYRCSRCWGLLVKTWVIDSDGQLKKTKDGEQLAEVKCQSENKDFGFVSKSFVESERSRDFNHAYEVKRDLIDLGVITKEKAYAD